METQPVNQTPQLDFETAVLSLTERHLQEWIEQLDYLRNSYGSADEIALCQSQITRLEGNLQQLQNR